MSAPPDYRKIPASEGHMTTVPLPSEDELSAFYAGVYYQELPSASYQARYDDEEADFKRLMARQIVHALAAAAGRSDGHLLEIGCGEGFTLAAARDAGWSVEGVDYSDQALTAFHPDLADRLTVGDARAVLANCVAQRRHLDAVVLQNVLEHVPDPRRLLDGVRGVLAPGGVVSVTLPNDESPVQRRLADLGHIDRDYWFVPPQHLHYFSIETGCAFARSCSYDVVDLYSDFPIEYFLFHPGSNFVADRANGLAAHRARIRITGLLAAAGMERFHTLCRAQAACGVGRAFTMLLKNHAYG